MTRTRLFGFFAASGFADADAIRSLDGENVHFLRKPFRLNGLQRTLRDVIAPNGIVSANAPAGNE